MIDTVIKKLKIKKNFLVNKVLILLGLLGLPYFFVFYAMGQFLYGFLIIVFVFLYAGCVVLNKFRYYNQAALGAILFPSLAIFIYSSVFTHHSGIQFSLIGLSTLSFLFFPSNKFLNYFGFFIPFLMFLILETTKYELFSQIELNSNVYFKIYIVSVISSFIIVFISMKIFNRENEIFRETLIAVNTEISQKSKDLIASNRSLQEANKKIKANTKQELYLKMAKGIQAQFIPTIEGMQYEQRQLKLQKGDILVTLSDGMEDMKNEANIRYKKQIGVKTFIENYAKSEGPKTATLLREAFEAEILRYTESESEVYADDISVFIASYQA